MAQKEIRVVDVGDVVVLNTLTGPKMTIERIDFTPPKHQLRWWDKLWIPHDVKIWCHCIYWCDTRCAYIRESHPAKLLQKVSS